MKKITLLCVAFALGLATFAQPLINSLEIAGRALKGTDEFGNSKPLTNIGNGDFVYYGYFYNTNPEKPNGSQGFKIRVNQHINASTDWNNNGWSSLVPSLADVPVSAGNNYAALYIETNQPDNKWRLASGEGWFKITIHTADLAAVNFDLATAESTFADIAALSIPNASLSPAFDTATTVYSCVLPFGTTSITPKVTGYYNIPVAGNTAVDVSGGSGVSTVVITSLDGSRTKTYTVNYTIAALSNNANLAALTLSAGSLVPAFHPAVTQYTVSVPANVTSVTATATKDDTNAALAGDGATDVTTSATQSISVTAENGTTVKTYTINYLKLGASETDITGLVVNNSFEYARTGVLVSAIESAGSGDGWFNNAWRPLKSTEGEFYGWNVTNWGFRSAENFSQGIQKNDISNVDGTWGIWVMGDLTFSSLWEIYQIVPATSLPAGTYKVQCRLDHEGGKITSQRLFANQNVQYHGTASEYPSNLTTGEINTFAGHTHEISKLKEMKVYTTIGDGDSLKIGIRTGGILPNGTASGSANPLNGGFKTDYFRVTKIDDAVAADATLATLSVADNTLIPDFNPQTVTYSVMLPTNITSVTPTATSTQADAKITGLETVDVSSGSGISTIVVTALDGTTTKTYTVTYSTPTSTNEVKMNCTWQLINRVLTVSGVDNYQVYSINGMKVADIQNNMADISVNLSQGIYILKTLDKAYKIVVK